MSQFKINQLRQKNIQTTGEVVGVLVLSVFVTVLLPQLLFQYFYADKQLTAEPPELKAIPAIAFGVGLLFALYGLAANFLRERQIIALTHEMEDQALAVSSSPVTADELAQLESIVEKAMDADQSAPPKKAGRPKKSSKK